jgi:hypothetical protein
VQNFATDENMHKIACKKSHFPWHCTLHNALACHMRKSFQLFFPKPENVHLQAVLQSWSQSRSRIILEKPDPEPQRDGDPARNLMFNIGGLSKKSQTVSVSYFFH